MILFPYSTRFGGYTLSLTSLHYSLTDRNVPSLIFNTLRTQYLATKFWESNNEYIVDRNDPNYHMVPTCVKWRQSETDTGSSEFQAATFTKRIAYLTDHLKDHPKDFSTRRGLV